MTFNNNFSTHDFSTPTHFSTQNSNKTHAAKAKIKKLPISDYEANFSYINQLNTLHYLKAFYPLLVILKLLLHQK